MYISILESPIGTLLIEANETSVFGISFPQKALEEQTNELSDLAKKQLNEYFQGERMNFDFPIGQDGTNFQQEVWEALSKIEAGKPISYATLAKKMNKPLAVRAIASANARNKLLIVIPCHRVIGSNGKLHGFSAGIWRKQWLIEHEARINSIGQSTLSF